MTLQADIEKLLSRIEDADDGSPTMGEIADALDSFAVAAEIQEVNCKRCDRPFRTIDGVEYCTRGCELGGWPGGHKQ